MVSGMIMGAGWMFDEEELPQNRATRVPDLAAPAAATSWLVAEFDEAVVSPEFVETVP